VKAPRILVAEAEGFPSEAVSLLNEVGTVILADLDLNGLREAIPKTEVLWVRLRHRIDAGLLAAAKDLKIVVTPTTGLNHIDTEELERLGIQLISLRGEVDFLKEVRATAEHTIGLILSLLRHIPQAAMDVQAGHWRRDRFLGSELQGKTVGIVGYGRLGKLVARYLQAFGCRLLAHDPILPATYNDGIVEGVALQRLLNESDLVTLHVDLRKQTWRFFGRDSFEKMKPGSYFINTSRGELIDESALIQALDSGRIAGAALDVLCGETPEGTMTTHPLVRYARTHSNIIVTPHLGGCTAESRRKTELFLAEKLFHSLHKSGNEQRTPGDIQVCARKD
jgi:D-3-phosphoglycerate dehydrogenase